DHPIDRILSAAQVVLVVIPGVMLDEREMTILTDLHGRRTDDGVDLDQATVAPKKSVDLP
ncbi:MAG: hypothetical protein H0W94_05620, partial [Actinobacteria bacterium]|nr:hypothetical protein [Actinomycetota bacterium]